MQISLAYVLIAAEIMLILFGISLTLGIILLRKPSGETETAEPIDETVESSDDAENELDAIDLGETYIDFLEQEIERNEKKKNQQENIENENTEDEDESSNIDDELSPAPDDKQSHLLNFREQFLLTEKSAAENNDHEIHFWDKIYDGMKNILEQFSPEQNNVSESSPNNIEKTSEKVFYIETQGQKIDGEVNKLKDIIFEQENSLSSMKKAMKSAEEEHPEESESLNALKEQIEAIERQLNDSKMCMEVLEMENNRLQEEVDKIETLNLPGDNSNSDTESDSVVDLEEMKDMVEEQKNKINELISTIESLELSTEDTEKLKGTINDFTRTSQEMMGCIAILEEENERLKSDEDHNENSELQNTEVDNETLNNDDSGNLQNIINSLEEEVIKKDVAYAQLQDEFSSMETEYLAMYEAMHGDNS